MVYFYEQPEIEVISKEPHGLRQHNKDLKTLEMIDHTTHRLCRIQYELV